MASGRTSGQNCSGAPEKSSFHSGHVRAFVTNEGVLDVKRPRVFLHHPVFLGIEHHIPAVTNYEQGCRSCGWGVVTPSPENIGGVKSVL